MWTLLRFQKGRAVQSVSPARRQANVVNVCGRQRCGRQERGASGRSAVLCLLAVRDAGSVRAATEG